MLPIFCLLRLDLEVVYGYTKDMKKNPYLVILFCIILVFVGFLFFKSEEYLQIGDKFRDEGRIDSAIATYERAKAFFPLRWDINSKIDGAKLILASFEDINGISGFVAEFQDQPPISEITREPLKPGQIFVPILMYHHIGVNPKPDNTVWAALFVTTPELDSQFNYLLKNGYHVISLKELYGALTAGTKLPDNPVVLTFDDGYRSFYENAFPLLKKYHLKATEFVITRGVGALAYLTWDQIVEMDRSGLVEIGAHTEHHPSLTGISAASAIEEIKGSKLDLESRLGKKIEFFAYPYGDFNDSVVADVRNAGYLAAVSTIYSVNQDKDHLFIMSRIMVNGRYGIDIFGKRIQK